MKACRVARRLAVDNFQSVELSSACIVFITLLGQDTSSLRLHLQVANQIAGHSTNQIAEQSSSQNAAASSIHQSSSCDVADYDTAGTAKVCKFVVLSCYIISL